MAQESTCFRRLPSLVRVSGAVTKPRRVWGGLKHGQEMDLEMGKQQIKHTLMQEKRCNFIMWNLIALHPHLNLLFQASVSCLIRQSTQ